MSFEMDTLKPVLDKGYSIVKSEIRYIVAWKDKDHPESEEIALVLPNSYRELFRKYRKLNDLLLPVFGGKDCSENHSTQTR